MTTCAALQIDNKRADEIIEEMKKVYKKGIKKTQKVKHNWALDFRDINKNYKFRNEAIFAIYSLTMIINTFNNQKEKLSIGELLCDLFSRDFGAPKCQ